MLFACVVGTRPDAIKTAPVVRELRRHAPGQVLLFSTGQHREMLDDALGAFGLRPDEDLAVMKTGGSLAALTAACLEGLDRLYVKYSPQMVLAQGDTTSTFAAALAAFYRKLPFGHIEAGLRTPSIDEPFPEELNRRATTLMSAQHYAPTRWAADNLARESVRDEVWVTGNTGIDAVRQVANATAKTWYPDAELVVLLTTHRRENWGEPQRAIARACRRIVEAFPAVTLVVPMHKNPGVRQTLQAELGAAPRVQLIEPPPYPEFVKLMQRSTLILSDSGGVQEEAPAFGVPVLVLRATTERPEGIESGNARLVGNDENLLFEEASRLLGDPAERSKMAEARSPYGDGRAAARIRYLALRYLGIASPEEPMWT